MTCPTGKVAFASPQAAQKVIGKVCKRNGGNKRAWTGGALRAYRCPFCRQFHSGHGIPHRNHAERQINATSKEVRNG